VRLPPRIRLCLLAEDPFISLGLLKLRFSAEQTWERGCSVGRSGSVHGHGGAFSIEPNRWTMMASLFFVRGVMKRFSSMKKHRFLT
jgi:hypothetical protein